MEKLEDYIRHKYTNNLPRDGFEKYCLMARFLDEQGEVALGYDAKMAFNNFKVVYGKRFLNDTPSENDWKDFFNDKVINDLLLNKTLQSKKVELRKWLNSLDLETTKLDLKDVKALDSLKAMIDSSDKYENNIVYVQYTCPIRYGTHNDKEIVESLLVRDGTSTR